MSKVESIQGDIQKLSDDELADLRQWFATFDAEAWDRQFEEDVRVGKLDKQAEWALRDHAAGKTTRFWPTTLRPNTGAATPPYLNPSESWLTVHLTFWSQILTIPRYISSRSVGTGRSVSAFATAPWP